MKVKFTFILKSGKMYDCIVDLTDNQFSSIINTVKTSFREGLDAYITLDYCIVRLSECAVIDWEVLDEQETKKS